MQSLQIHLMVQCLMKKLLFKVFLLLARDRWGNRYSVYPTTSLPHSTSSVKLYQNMDGKFFTFLYQIFFII